MGLGIADRLKVIIDSKTDKRGKFAQLESITPITAENWKSFYYGRQRPNADMIEAIARAWPQYALWLATGYVDPAYGHSAPSDHGFPKKSMDQSNTAAYFKEVENYRREALALAARWYKESFDEVDVPSRALTDSLLRCAHLLGMSDEETKRTQDALRNVAKAEKLRRAEILLNSEMPNIDYDQTAALGETIQELLDKVLTTETNSERKEELQQKLDDELKRLQRHVDYTREHSLKST
ncbi:hypothetical protein [Janthinobacterium sp. PAMC25594]|jgi:hypothetical protein|uniref:hypothetical protein n=1 Tax=Janthinobacterium sp. PAMC25594 TaxID=2861284 RepID=UPI001C627B3D|nr:hypothetical protein [Janthinobacterium sp. PAMC25594]QYG05078.1 hypothetical protein KY494_17050 [Janthinobacterium sp. PAMC25594]